MPKTILLADDSVTIQKVIELTFMDEDYEVVSVGNGDEALDRLEEVTPDVVIADVHMPGASGYDVAKRARQLHPHVPVLLLVGTFEPFDESDYEASGASGYLKKPFDSQELLTRVGKLMADRPAPAERKPAAAPAAEPAAPASGAGAGEPREEELVVPAASTEELPSPSGPPAAGVAAGAWATEAFTPPSEADETVDRASWAAETPAWDDEKTDPFRLARQAEPQRETDLADPTATRAIPAAGREPGAGVAGWQGSAWDLEAAEAERAEEAPAEAAGAEQEGSPWTGGWELEEEPAPTQVRPPEPETAGRGAAATGESREETAAEIAAPAAEEAATAREDAAPAAAPPVLQSEAGGPAAADPFPELTAPPVAPPPSPAAAEASRSASPEPAAPAPAAPPAAPAAGPAAGPQGLSDEDVDRIARRVAELIGDPILREVAWEVVPDLAEVVIKDRLRELEAQVD